MGNKISEKALELAKLEKKQRNAYTGGDIDVVHKAIADKTLCAVVQKWIIRDKRKDLIVMMKNCDFQMTSALQRFYRQNATEEMKRIYNF